MAYTIVEVDILSDKKSKNTFIDLPFQIYKNESNWVPPLKISLHELLTKKHPFFKTSKTKSWLLLDEKQKAIGRIMAIINHNSMKFHHDRCGFFGFLDAIDDKEAFAQLIQAAEDFLKSEGMAEIRGPVNPSTNYECGVLVEGFEDPAQLMMTYNHSYYDRHLKDINYEKAMDLLAYNVDEQFNMPPIFKKISARVEKSERITYRPVRKKDWAQEVERMFQIYNSAWEKNWGFIPMTREEFLHMANDLKMVVDERLVLFAEVHGKPAGFIIALPDYNQIFKKIPSGKLLPTGIFKILLGKKKINRVRVITMGIKEEYRKLGLASLLYHKCHEEIKKVNQYNNIEMSWILESNYEMNKPLIKMGADVYKRYRIYNRPLTTTSSISQSL